MIQVAQVPQVPPVPPVIVQAPDVMPPPWVTLPPQVTLLIAVAFFAACAVVLYPLMRALGRRLEGRSGAAMDPALLTEIEQLRHRVAELEGMQHRVMELEDRLDFAERLLAQRREVERLPRGDA